MRRLIESDSYDEIVHGRPGRGPFPVPPYPPFPRSSAEPPPRTREAKVVAGPVTRQADRHERDEFKVTTFPDLAARRGMPWDPPW